MGKSILELFKTKPLNEIKPLDGNSVPYTGKTSADKYDVRNSKDIPVSSNSALMQPFFWAINKLRLNETLTARTKEHLVEEELVGLRPLRAISTTVLYGSNLLRLTTKTTPTVTAMKQSTNGQEETGGLIGRLLTKVSKGSVNSLEQLNSTINSKLGIPQSLYPTSYATRFENDPVFDRMITIGEIKNDGKGTILGKFLKDSGGGTPQQLAKQLLGNGITFGKNALRSKLFGTPTTVGKNEQLGFSYNRPSDGERMFITRFYSGGEFAYTSIKFDESVSSDGEVIDAFSFSTNGASSAWDIANSKLRKGSVIGDKGKVIDMDALKPPVLRRDRKNGNTKDNLPSYTNSTPGYTAQTLYGDKDENLETKRGLYSDKDVINQTGRVTLKEATDYYIAGKGLEDIDLIPLRFQRMSDGSMIYMRSVVTSFNESYTPTFESARMIGSPFNFYNYSSVERKISFGLKVYAMSQAELLLMWTKLDYLAHLTFPAGYNDGVVQPNLFYFTFGNLYIDKPAILTNLTFAIDDSQNLWEIGGKFNGAYVNGKVKAGNFDQYSGKFSIPNYKGESNSSLLYYQKDSADTNKIYTNQYRPVNDKENVNEVMNNIKEASATAEPYRYNLLLDENDNPIDMNKYKLPKFINASFDITFLETVSESNRNLYDTGKSITYGYDTSKNYGSNKFAKRRFEQDAAIRDRANIGSTPSIKTLIKTPTAKVTTQPNFSNFNAGFTNQ